MTSRIWKEYVHMCIEDIEAARKSRGVHERQRTEREDLGAFIKPETQSWCATFDRCMAYTFESYCKLVVSRALQYAHTNKEFVLTKENINKATRSLFNTSREEPGKRHDSESCFSHYRDYVSWYNRIGYRIHGKPYYSRRNLTSRRLAAAYYKNRAVDNKSKSNRVTVDLGRFESVAPKHKTIEMSLDQVFER